MNDLFCQFALRVNTCKTARFFVFFSCFFCFFFFFFFWGGGGSACQELNWYCINGLVLNDARASVQLGNVISMMMTHFNLFSSGSIEVIFQIQLKKFFFLGIAMLGNEILIEDAGRPFSWILYCFYFSTVSIMSCIFELGGRMATLDRTRVSLRLSHWYASLALSEEKNTANKMLQSSFAIIAHVFLTNFGTFNLSSNKAPER